MTHAINTALGSAPIPCAMEIPIGTIRAVVAVLDMKFVITQQSIKITNVSTYVLTFVIFMLCCVMTNFMSNTATTALMVPIGISIAQGMGADPSAVLMACVIGGSCAYATPIGMPANTMVVTAGGYTFKDYAKAGVPMILVATVVSMILLPIFYPFFPG